MKQILYCSVMAVLVIFIDSKNYVSNGENARLVDTSKKDLDQWAPIVRKPRGSGASNYICCTGGKSDDSSVDSCDEFSSSATTPAHVDLPPTDPSGWKITLVLDLDETLIYSSRTPFENTDHTITVTINRHPVQMYIKKRPHLEQFLRRICPLFDCVIFTAGASDYATELTAWLKNWGHFIGSLSREHCLRELHEQCMLYIKDLRILGRDLNRVVIMDNSPTSFMYQKENAILVETWEGDQNDEELLKLIPFLTELSQKADIFPHLKLWQDTKNPEEVAKKRREERTKRKKGI